MALPQTGAQKDRALALKAEHDSVRAVLEKMKPQLAIALPKHVNPDRMLRIVLTACHNTPKLLECDRSSLFAAVMTSAQLGLEPDGVLGQAYLVPFAGKVQFIVGYKGYLSLARNSGEVATVQAHEVCAGDEFSYEYGLNEDLRHKVIAEERTWDNVTHFYAYAIFKDGGRIFEVLTRKQVEAIRNNSQGYKAFKSNQTKSNPWDPAQPTSIQMGRKTLIRRIANYLPMSVQRAAALDAAYDQGQTGNIGDLGEIVVHGAEEADEPQQLTDQTGAAGANARMDALAGQPATEKTADAGQPAEAQQSVEKTPAKGKATKKPAGKTVDSTATQVKKPADDGAPTKGELVAKILRATTAKQVDDALEFANDLDSDEDIDYVRDQGATRKQQLVAEARASAKPAAEPTPAAGTAETPLTLFGGDE